MNIREAENIDTIDLLASATASDRDTYANLYRMVASIMAELVIVNKNLVEALKENNRLERVLGQYQKSTRSGDGAAMRGCTYQQKKGDHYCYSCGYEAGHPSFKCTTNATGHLMHC